MEGDANRSIPSYPNFLLPEIKSSTITDPFIASDGLLLLPNAHAITILLDVRSTVETSILLTTSSNSWLKTGTSNLNYKAGDAAGPFAVGVAVEESAGNGETRVAWFSSSSLLTDDIDQMVSGNNTNLVLNSIGWMTEQEDSTTIRPKSTESTTLRLTFGQAMQWTLLFVAVIPLVVLAVGIVVCVRRRCQK